ncbi:uncharacterized protein LOC142552570 isoform X2 [Primulina tabacum]|uniref:uncharacterized protein LOC142552570 isoform X2 n=1 Tax=Primulina tabacum TaxID=48773 RepID=UPI003F595879
MQNLSKKPESRSSLGVRLLPSPQKLRNMEVSAIATPLNLAVASVLHRSSRSPSCYQRNLGLRPTVSALSSSYGDSSVLGFTNRTSKLPSKVDQNDFFADYRNLTKSMLHLLDELLRRCKCTQREDRFLSVSEALEFGLNLRAS